MTPEQIREKRKAYHKALAFLKRSRLARIPEEHLRINSDDFSKLLNKTYVIDNQKDYVKIIGEYDSKDLKSFAKVVYDQSESLLKLPYIVIDGGNDLARRRAAFALMFRFIINDKWAYYSECIPLAHEFEFIDTSHGAFTRNDWVASLKRPDVLYLGEFDPKLFNEHFWVGSFFDDILVDRMMSHKLTIVSFVKPLSENNKIKDKDCGKTLADLSVRYKPSSKAFRIQVVPYES